ncbi:Unknown protein [Striga hermonthica]|uniref:Reverse transcriptase domain-containing protein n=1 Tax=Striga hermonthica TaxID=68872 RepID=A0A9N7MUV4_STRHE|nr:Unknown protein [Striga hermonthica]
MQRVFDDMLHKSIECYVDDVVVNSRKREDHLEDLKRVFGRLRRYQLKMNPLKCAFGVKSGKFLGFIVRHRGIEIEQAKIDAILRIPEPRDIHELKSLQGKLAYLRRFISNLAGRCQPFNRLMKKGKTSESDPIHLRTRTVTTKVPEGKVHVYKQGKGPIKVIKTVLAGWDQDQLQVREILEKYKFKSIYAFAPKLGRGVPIWFNPRNGQSLLTYRDGVVIMLMGSPIYIENRRLTTSGHLRAIVVHSVMADALLLGIAIAGLDLLVTCSIHVGHVYIAYNNVV